MLTGGARLMVTGLLILFALSILIVLLKQIYTERRRRATQTPCSSDTPDTPDTPNR